MKRAGKDRRSIHFKFAGQKSQESNKSLTEQEEKFLEATEFGDIPTVRRILDEKKNFFVDFTDIIGRTPLQLAVANEHLEVVELLLDRSNLSNIHEALLHAISTGHEHIAECILKHTRYREQRTKNKRIGETDYFFNRTNEESPFSSDITPLILASERNQFEIVQLLLMSGEKIKRPHHYYCNCQECSNKLEYDELRLAKTRLNAYKGLASSTYISLTSPDPILTSFELARELRNVAIIEKCFKTDYLKLADQLSKYVVQLLDKVRGHDELEILLNKKDRDPDVETYDQLKRLRMAIYYKEKKFVAHSSCQQKLISIWYNDIRILERTSFFFRTCIVLGITICYPLLVLAYCFFPNSKPGQFLRYPCIKFIGHTMSFIVLLCLIMISTIGEESSTTDKLSHLPHVFVYYSWYRNTSTDVLPEDFVIRQMSPDITLLCLNIWIVGMLWQEMKQIYKDGISKYYDSIYNYLDMTVLKLYITSFVLMFISIMKTNEAITFFSNETSWVKISRNEDEAKKQFYWLIADRYYWDSWDPHNIADGMFAIANVISFSRLTYFLYAYEAFGPMQISLTKMISDILKFTVIFLVLFIAFMVGLHNLYWYYPKEIRSHMEFLPNNITTKAEVAFGFPTTFRTVFWSLFGRGEPQVVELGEFNHYFTQNVGYWIYGAYNIATVIVLLNMLIAMMSRSFETIQEEADIEWKFARSQIYMEFISEGLTLPIPFNIIPTKNSIVSFLCCCCNLDTEKEDDSKMDFTHQEFDNFTAPTWRNDVNISPTISEQPEQDTKLTYQTVMRRIVKRYIFDAQRSSSKEDDFEEIKQDISSFRYEILNYLQQREKDTQSVTNQMNMFRMKMDNFMAQQGGLLQKFSPHMNTLRRRQNSFKNESRKRIVEEHDNEGYDEEGDDN